MPTLVEFIIPRRPLSHQAKNSENKRAWRDFVYGRAHAAWRGLPLPQSGIKLTVVHLCEADPIDINNIIKPIEDALVGLIYADDVLVTDVTGHLRMLSDPIEVDRLPPMLADAVFAGGEAVYVRLSFARGLQEEVVNE